MQLTNQHITRHIDIIPSEVLGKKITIIGAGAVGSWVTMGLVKMGLTDITVYDYDKIEIENMSAQMYRMSDIGRFKVAALGELIEDFTGVVIETKNEMYETGTFTGIVISALDSMEGRKQIWMNHKNKAPFTQAIIDPRMGAETALLYVMNPMSKKDQDSYETTLYTDESAVQEKCTARTTPYCAIMLAGLVVKAVKDLLVTPDKYLRTAQWSIKENQLFAWKNPS